MRQRGFSLLEVLVAFAILALSLGVLMRIYSGALNHVDIARDQAEALLIAQSLLTGASADMPLVMGETAGRIGERFRWQLTVSPYSPEGEDARGNPSLLMLREISVRVAWRDSAGAREREVALQTLRAEGAPAR